MNRRVVSIAGLAALALVASAAARAESWVGKVPVWRVGILGGENEADRLKRYDCLKAKITGRFGVPVELYPAADYAGVMQGLISGNLEAAGLGPAGYAGIWLQDPKAVEPLVTVEQVDGSLGYYAVLYVKADSPFRSLDELKGRSLAYADPNSTSGYLVPRFELKRSGFDPDRHFGRTGFAGGHEQAVVAVLNGQHDAGVTWISGVGDPAEGYSRGNLRRMVDKGALKMSDIRILWQSSLIANGPTVVRSSLPAEVKAGYKDFLLGLAGADEACFQSLLGGEGVGFVPIGHEFYENIIEMRRGEAAARRG
jgi:phosphonate transport system substrate-binding protein